MLDNPYNTMPIKEILSSGEYEKLTQHMADLIEAKNQAHLVVAKARHALRPVNHGSIKATEADRTVEMEAKTADHRYAYDNLADLHALCMELIKR